jgi:zinc protease
VIRQFLTCSTISLSCLWSAGLLVAQGSAVPKNPDQVRLNRAPVSDAVLTVHLPVPEGRTLPNGLRVLVLSDHSAPVVSLTLSVNGAGPLLEPEGQAGVAGLTSSAMRVGTTSRSSKQLSEAIDTLGAHIETTAPLASSVALVTAGGLSENFGSWFDLFADVVLHPSVDPNEYSSLQQRSIAGLEQRRVNPNQIATERMFGDLYKGYPAEHYRPSAAQLAAVTREQILAWHGERYVPQNSILAIAGDISANQAFALAQKKFGTWQKTDLQPVVPIVSSEEKKVSEDTVTLVERPNSVQTTLAIGKIGISRVDPDYFPLLVGNAILGGGTSGRLFSNLREQHGYTYGAYSSLSPSDYAGPFIASADVRNAVTEAALTEFLKEIKRMATEKVSADDLRRAKRSIVAGFALSLESPATLLNQAITRERYHFPADYWNTFPAHINAVTADDIERVSGARLSPGQMHIVAVGGADLVPVLQHFGRVQQFDANGHLIPSKP